MSSGQKQNTNFIPYCKGASNLLYIETAKFTIHVPIKPAWNICQHIKSDRDKDPMKISGIFRTEYIKNNEIGYDISLWKQKIEERIERTWEKEERKQP